MREATEKLIKSITNTLYCICFSFLLNGLFRKITSYEHLQATNCHTVDIETGPRSKRKIRKMFVKSAPGVCIHNIRERLHGWASNYPNHKPIITVR